MRWYELLIVDLAGLFLAGCLYALVLRLTREWYRRENKTYVMLIGGVVLTLAGIGVLIPFGVVDLASWAIFILGFCAIGLPVAVGEKLQDAREAGIKEGRKKSYDEDQRR